MKFTESYIKVLEILLSSGYDYPDPNRTGEGVTRKEKFGITMFQNIAESFPMLTTKQMWPRGIFAELHWMLNGDTNARSLMDKNIHVWSKDAYNYYIKKSDEDVTYEEFLKLCQTGHFSENGTYPGELGPIYGEMWRQWTYKSDDQLYADYLRKVQSIQ